MLPLASILAVVLQLCVNDANCAPPPQASPTRPAPATQQQRPARPATIDDTAEAGDEDTLVRSRRFSRWNEFDGKWASIRFGGGLLVDAADYRQDEASQDQFELSPEVRMRDGRLLFKGRLKFPHRKVTWSAGFMYDGVNDVWLVRQTGIQIDLPEIKGSVFIGRQKEGFSMSKIMVGYHGWGMERMPMNDASVQLLADGVKVTGYARKHPLTWNFGVFTDALSEKQSFSIADHQVIGRLVWQPILSDEGRGNLLHIGVALRYAKSDDGQLQPRSRPEAYLAPYFVDTGKFPANSTTMTGLELYYRPGPLLIGAEYMFQHVDAPDRGNPFFHGGDVSVVWLATGESRSYNRAGGYFNAVSPARSVFSGGLGAWEIVARYSYVNLDSDSLQGGKFWRFTPMVNWHLDDSVRLEFVYGYGALDRFSLVGHTQFFQTRLQVCF